MALAFGFFALTPTKAQEINPPQISSLIPSTATGTWSSLQLGVDSTVYATVADGGNIYIGGSFFQTCGNTACNSGNTKVNNVAMWNGSSWQRMGYGFNGNVYALAVSNGTIYAGGFFDRICANETCSTYTTVRNLAKWNGSSWSGVANGVDSYVYALAVSGNNLYVGGGFNNICGNAFCNSGNTSVNFLARWDASISTWLSIGYGVNWDVRALAVSGSDLYVGGVFDQVCLNAACLGGVTVNRMAKWSFATSNWQAFSNGLDGLVSAISVNGSDVYVGGDFTHACTDAFCNPGANLNRIARWNNGWTQLGSGLNGWVTAIFLNDGNIYTGGTFNASCANATCSTTSVQANHIAKWNGGAWSPLGNGVNGQVNAVVVDGNNLFTGGSFLLTCADAACTAGNISVNRIAAFDLSPVPVTKVFRSAASEDGWILESAETSGNGGTMNSAASLIYLGDNTAKKQYRSILSFDTSSLPDNAIITKVTLKLRQQGINGGGNPVSIFQGFVVDVKKGMFGTAPLALNDFKSAASKTVGPASPALTAGWYTLNLTPAKGFINKLSTNSGLTQIRLRFKLDDNNNNTANFLKLYSGNAGAGNRPQLIIEYDLP